MADAVRRRRSSSGRGEGLPGRRRRAAFSAAALFFALIWLYFGFGIIDLSYVIFVAVPAPAETVAVAVSEEVGVLEVAYGAVATFMVAGAFLRQVAGPAGWATAVRQVVALMVAFSLAGAAGLDILSFVGVASLAVTQGVLWALWPVRPRPRLVPETALVSRKVLAVALVGAGPWLLLAWEVSANSRAGLVPEEEALRPQAGGWAGVAVLAFAVVLLTLLAATRTPGWRLPLWSTVAAVLAFSTMVVRFPNFPGSPGRVWGVLAAVWVIALAAVAEIEGRRSTRGTARNGDEVAGPPHP
jgi:hypothetical protein